jgi:hypothetical protein
MAMSFYAVRTSSERKLIGLFFAESLPHLVVDVSKVASTENCEFVELGGGGIVWRQERVPVPASTLPWEKCELTESWQRALGDSALTWMPLLTTEDVTR